jgi:hypothetical protein
VNFEPYSTPEVYASALCTLCGHATDVRATLTPVHGYHASELHCGHVAITHGAKRFALSVRSFELAVMTYGDDSREFRMYVELWG